MFAILISRYFYLALAGLCFSSCNSSTPVSIGSFEKLEPEFDAIISSSASIEIIADSLDWSEGPLWLEDQQTLLFSDIPPNTIYKWTAEGGKQVYLKPSGYTSPLK